MFGTSNLALRFTIVPVMVMLVLIGGLYATNKLLMTRQLREQNSLRIEQRATLLADRLAAALAVRVKEVELLARSAALAEPRGARQRDATRTELEWLRSAGKAYAWIGVAALDGTVLAGTQHGLEGQSIAASPVFGGGQLQVVVADFHPPPVPRAGVPSSNPVAVAELGVPVRDAAGNVVAVMIAQLSASWFTEIGDRTVTDTETERLGLDAYILTSSGHPLSEAPPFAVKPSGAAAFWVTGSDGHDYLVAVRDVPLLAPAAALNWRVVVTQNAAFAAAEVRQFEQILIGFSLAAVLACIALGLLAARHATQPYSHLLGAAEARFKAAGGRATMPYASYLDALGDDLLRDQAAAHGTDRSLFLRLASDARQFKQVIDHMPMGVAISSADFRVEYLNPVYTRMLGWTTEQVYGRRTAEFLFDAADAADFVRQFESLPSPPNELVARFVALRPDGTRLPVQWHMVPLFDRHDRFEGVLALVQDISGEAMERRRANQLAQQLSVFADAAADYALIMLDAGGAFQSWSRGAVRLTGLTTAEALQTNLASLFGNDAHREAEPMQLLQAARDDKQCSIAHWMVRADGTSFFGEGTLYALQGVGDEPGFALVLSDRSRDRVAAQRIAESEARLAAVIDGASDAIVSTDVQGAVVLFNPAAERLFGVTSQAMFGQPLDRLMPDIGPNTHRRQLGQFPASPINRQATPAGQLQGVRADGGLVELEASISKASVGGGTVLTAILRDVTERERAQQALVAYQVELADLTQRLLAQEKETTRKLAQTLHDDLGQTLAALRLIFDVGPALVLKTGGNAAWFDRIDRLVTDANKQVRRVLTQLRPPLLDEQGLIAALDNELDQHGLAQDNVQLLLDAHLLPAEAHWPHDVEYAAFMVAREAINNALRHAAPKRVLVELSGDARQLMLAVSDDGGGLARIEHVVRPGHLGLVGMRERALAIGAALDISSSPETGTTVTLRWAHTETPSG